MANQQKSGTTTTTTTPLVGRLESPESDNKANKNCDANNNANCDQPTSGPAAAVGTSMPPVVSGANFKHTHEEPTHETDCSPDVCSEVAKRTRGISNSSSNSSLTRRKQRESNLSDRESSSTDDWHLLDVDEHSSSSLAPSESNSPRASRRQKVIDANNEIRGKGKLRSNNSNKMPDALNESRNNNYKRSSSSSEFIIIDQDGREQFSATLVYLCTGLYSLLPLASLVVFATFIYLLIFTKLWFIPVIYYSYLILDSKTCNRGGRRWDFVYRSKFWSYLAAYFPIRLKYSRNFELNPSENYILNYHPHGICALGCVSAFATNGLGFSKLFPGIKSRFMVHETSFLTPVMRETFGFRGDCSVSSASFDYILSKKWRQEQKNSQHAKSNAADGAGGASHHQEKQQVSDATGNLLALCGGGLAEADLSDMQKLKIVCATRKGFVKKALIHGANLVPCIAFGENSVYKKVNLRQGSLLQRLELKWYQLFKFKHPIYYGISLFAGSKLKGVMPFKRPITVCMADPISVERCEEPSQKQIDSLHALYMERLLSLYEENRDLCDEYDRSIELV